MWDIGVGDDLYRVSLAFIWGDCDLDGVCRRVVGELLVRGWSIGIVGAKINARVAWVRYDVRRGGCARRLMRSFCRGRWFCRGGAVGALFRGRSVRGQIVVACGAVAVMELAESLLRMRRVGGRRDAGTLSVMSAGRACFYMRVGGKAAADGAATVMAQSSPNQSTMVVDWPGPRKIEFLHLTPRDTS